MTQMPPPLELSTTQLAYATPAADAQDIQHLKLLSIFHFVVGGLAMLFGTFPLIHVVMGVLILSGKFMGPPNGPPNPAFLGWIFIAIGSTFILIGWTMGLLTIYAGLQLRQQRRRMFCVVIAAILCAFLPLGTVLGIFTLIVLYRPSVQALYASR